MYLYFYEAKRVIFIPFQRRIFALFEFKRRGKLERTRRAYRGVCSYMDGRKIFNVTFIIRWPLSVFLMYSTARMIISFDPCQLETFFLLLIIFHSVI